MKYSVELIINVPINEFVEKMNEPENMKHWQRGLIKYEQIEGLVGATGAKMKMEYIEGKRKFELVETIKKSAFPDEFHASYSMPGMTTLQKNYFTDIDGRQTKWLADCEFTSDKIMYKLMLTFLPFIFKKQSLQMMNDFKSYVEEGTSVIEL